MFIPIGKDNLQKNFFVFLNFIWFVSRISKNEKKHKLWTAQNLTVACVEFLWIDLMLDYVLQWKGIWYYRYDMVCCLQFSEREARSLMVISIHYYCNCPWIHYNVLSLDLLYKSAFIEEYRIYVTPGWSRKFDDNTMYYIFIEILYQPLIRSSTFASVRMYRYNEKKVNYADWIIEIINIMEMISAL